MTNKQSGFTLIELAIVLMVSGLLLGGAMAMMKPYVGMAQSNATREKLKNIADSLAMFAQTYNRLPCPANPNPGGTEPFGSPIRSGVNGTNFITQGCGAGGVINGTIPNDYVGIVPFRALGLTEDNVRDGYGNLITYAVSAVLAVPVPAAPSPAPENSVQQVCRTAIWTDGTTAYNANKARFCCPYFRSAVSDIQVLDGLASATQVFIPADPHDAGAGYASVTTTVITPTDFGNRLIAFTLVSHGKNGDGAYIGNSAVTNPVTVNAGAQESENRNGNLIFVDRPITLSNDNNYFDDIVVWRTNDQLFSVFGDNSCGRP